MKKISFSFLLLILCAQFALSQVVSSDPILPVEAKPVTIYFYATKGTGGLTDYTGDVYAHTGVFTNLSPASWKYVKTGWGENTPETKLNRISPNLYSLEIAPSIRDYYGVPGGETITTMCFVFRSEDNSREGKDDGGADIFVQVFDDGINIKIITPTEYASVVDLNESFPISIASSYTDTMAVYLNNTFLHGVGASGELVYNLPTDEYGEKKVKIWAANETEEVLDSIVYLVISDPPVVELPEGVEDGINYLSESSVILSFYAPGKKNVFAVGDFSDWYLREEFFMNITPDGEHFWIQIDNLDKTKLYRFYYKIDHGDGVGIFTRLPDQHTELLIDPNNDKYISETTYPGITDLYSGLENIQYSVIKTDRTPYNWKVPDFTPPEKADLVIYEVLLRDFLTTHSWKTLKDTLSYLETLGINAIELMPFNEYNGNESWGYNPTYYFAPDKYYGPPEDLKAFVDECHSRGIAVIQDIAFNHVEYWSTYTGLYQDVQGYPSDENPWLNADYDLNAPGYQTRHPYSVFMDFDQSSLLTQNLIDRATKYWMEEYQIDGFRFDLTKGFTQKATYLYYDFVNGYAVYDEGAASAYDAERIGYLKRMADAIWTAKDDAYVILEHFCDNTEEKELANYGMMVWGNHNYNYNEATMGYNDSGKSNFGGISFQNREWTYPHLIGYMESHDEERLMYKNLQYGNSKDSYNVKDLYTALARVELAATFFFTIPGPKMIWQFGELGYDYTIDYNGRVGNKPIKWSYYDIDNRKRLYQVFSALIKLKTSEPAFSTYDYTLSVASAGKRIELNHDDMDVRIIGNFDVDTLDVVPNFSKAGTWFEYFTGESISVTNLTASLSLAPGEYRIYTTKQLEKPDIISSLENKKGVESGSKLYPIPATEILNLVTSSNVERIAFIDLNGRLISREKGAGTLHTLDVSHLNGGIYFLKIEYEQGTSEFLKFIKQ